MPKRTVGELMTPRPVVLSPDVTVDRALQIARERRIHHFLIDSDDCLVRVVCLCDLLHTQPLEDALDSVPRQVDRRSVAEIAQHRTFVVGPADTLEDAGELMSREGIGCLPVVENGAIVGVLTRADLRRSGETFDAILDARCASCGSTHDVRRAEPGGAGFCPDCWSQSGAPRRDDEIGVGD